MFPSFHLFFPIELTASENRVRPVGLVFPTEPMSNEIWRKDIIARTADLEIKLDGFNHRLKPVFDRPNPRSKDRPRLFKIPQLSSAWAYKKDHFIVVALILKSCKSDDCAKGSPARFAFEYPCPFIHMEFNKLKCNLHQQQFFFHTSFKRVLKENFIELYR